MTKINYKKFHKDSMRGKNEVGLEISDILYINGLVEDCNNSIAEVLELPQSYNKPST